MDATAQRRLDTLRAIEAFQRQRARREGIEGGRGGAVTVIQRFASGLRLNIHGHTLVRPMCDYVNSPAARKGRSYRLHNGGQNAKRCMMEARLAGRQPTAVTHDAATVERAVDGAAEKLKRSVESSLGRMTDH